MGTTPTPFDMDAAISALQLSFSRIFGVALGHIETAAVEPHFPDGRNDWVYCSFFAGPKGPILMYLGTQTMMEESRGGAGGSGQPNWDDYAWTVMRTLASQTQQAFLDENINKPYTELPKVG